MKYIVEMTRFEAEGVEVTAPTRDKALAGALVAFPGFKAECVIELDDAGEEKETHGVYGRCETCEKVIWEGDECAEDEDGIKVCAECFEQEAQP